MSTDSSELTFVRCPSCRSLVPAMSTRCRMCGAALEMGNKNEDAEKEKRASRIRQRTMSETAPEDVSDALNRVREEPPPAVATSFAPPVSNGAERVDAGQQEDPLAAYIEEVEVAEPPKKISAPLSVAPPAEPPVEPEVRREEPRPAQKPGAAMFGETAPSIGGETAGDEDDRPEQPRVIVESGARKGNKPSSLSFNRGKNEQPREARSEPTPAKPTPTPISRETHEERHESVEAPRSAKQPRENAAPPSQPREKSPAARGSGAEKGKGVAGRLFGWLVSYRIAEGHAVELREGKFFVTQSSLKEHDLVLEDDSVSTPHALITVHFEQGLGVQDLMSERGVHVRRRREDSYQRIAESDVLRHGDWVRFGDVEFLVSLIAHVGER